MGESQRQEQKNRTRKHLISVAFDRLAKDGLVSTSTSDIAKAAGVSHGTVFAHFATRDELLTAVIEEFGNRISLRLHELASNGGSIREVLNAHLKGLIEFEPFYRRLVMDSHLLPESARSTLIMIQSVISFHISEVAEREIKSGKIRPHPIHLLFNTWIGLVHYYLANSDLFTSSESVLSSKGGELLEYFTDLITKQERF